ncbi:MAG: glutamate--tRNA ligase family protein, partial [Pseudomonadota bacterium]|nr:glutamate--tRNA ligase family protein [Pseudomonadota bacterium]
MILLRADGTPTYMLSVVVDDIDMGITHIVRGDDHLTNAARQNQLYSAIGAVPPVFAHVPLIHGPDGAKLSKRHGALGIEAYRDMGYLPEAMRNYLLRLGWGHGDEEIVPTGRALELFDLDGIGKAPARIDMTKLDHLNGHYLRISYDARLVDLIVPMMNVPVDETGRARLLKGMASLKERAKTLVELAENALFYVQPNPLSISDKAQKLIDAAPEGLLAELADMFATLPCFDRDNLEQAVRNLSEAKELKLGKIAQPLRAALTGSNASPPIFEVAEILGREETIARLRNGVDG